MHQYPQRNTNTLVLSAPTTFAGLPISVASVIVKMLEDLGVQYAFGISGGAIVPLWHTLQHNSSIKVVHFRHEAGAAFAATEAYFASGRPVVVFTTTGPGITNALTGLFAARWENAKVMFVKALLKYFPKCQSRSEIKPLPRPQPVVRSASTDSLVRPEVLMNVIQQVVVEGSDAIVMAEGGNSFAWAINLLRFAQPGRFRVSTGFGAMGHFVTSVVGTALIRKTVAIVGDGAMLMNNEISTAVNYQIPAVWIVLNDGRYNMCAQGTKMQGYRNMDVEIPQTDFVMFARSMGADGIRVSRESDIQAALEKALVSTSPVVVDIIIDPTRLAPIGGRICSLISQGAKN
jgi:thiamine pyrophosphate-dependent acetolactate synthase large subunit-like protein